MNAEGWHNVDRLFQVAAEIEPSRRAAYLENACAGDWVLRGEVEELLSSDSLNWDFLEKPAIESAALFLADDEPVLSAGERVGHYEIVSLLGKGGMGEVYLARDRILNRNIALKLLPFDYTQDAGRLRRFQREAQTVSTLNHPNIITIHELGSLGDQQYIATEFVEGETLRDLISRRPMLVDEVLEILIQIAGALAAAHEAGIIHRDIKPENVMVRHDGYVKVLDFGLAKLVGESELRSESRMGERHDLSSGLLMGTLRYMSPEQVNGDPVDAATDIFSLGSVVYEMITGQPAFDDENPAKLGQSILKDHPALSDVPKVLRAVLAKMLSKDKRDRYENAVELVRDLNILKRSMHAGRLVPAASSISGRPAFLMVLIIGLIAIGTITYSIYNLAPAAARPGKWTSKSPISSPRWQAEPAVLNDTLYIAGGWNVCTPFANLEAYNPQTDTWTQRAPMHTARGGHGVAVLDGKVYAAGGSTDCDVHIASVEAYEPATDSWSEKAPLPSARFGHSVASSNGKLYAMGGQTSKDGSYLQSNSEYDPAKDKWIERAPMPTARSAAAVAIVNGIIYVVGGSSRTGVLGTVEAYDPTADSWTTKRSMLVPREGFAASEAGGLIYAFGGNGSGTEVEAYDPATDSWTVVSNMPVRTAHAHAATLGDSIYFAGGSDGFNYLSTVTAFTPEGNAVAGSLCPKLVTTSKADMISKRSNMSVGEIGGIIYAAGGYENSARFLTTNEAYDISADRWLTKAPMPGARETRGTNNAVADGKLFVIGGNARGTCSSLNEAYDPTTDSWSTRSPMPTPRCHLAVVALNNLIYALGGTNTNGSLEYDIVEVYDPGADTWTTAAPMPTGRQDLGAVSLNGILYAVGGGNPISDPDRELRIVEAYDPSTNAWTSRTPMPTARAGMAVGVLSGMLVAAGGSSNRTPSATVDAYDAASDTWRTVGQLPTRRSFLSAVTVDNTMYILGGNGAMDNPGSLKANEALTLVPCAGNQ